MLIFLFARAFSYFFLQKFSPHKKTLLYIITNKKRLENTPSLFLFKVYPNAALANLSASSLPATPVCPATLTKVTIFSRSFIKEAY